METYSLKYLDNLRVHAVHDRSGTELLIDAPVDNEGRGERFSPTDMVATALGACMLIIMGIAAKRHNFSIDGTKVKAEKIMISDPRRIGEIVLEFDFCGRSFSDKEKKILEAATNNCPVGKSIDAAIKQTVRLNF